MVGGAARLISIRAPHTLPDPRPGGARPPAHASILERRTPALRRWSPTPGRRRLRNSIVANADNFLSIDRNRSRLFGRVKSFPGRLHHVVPPWVRPGSCFHIRIRAERGHSLIDRDSTATSARNRVLEEAAESHRRQLWHCRLMLVMPDHLHAMIAFPRTTAMSTVISSWKRLVRIRHDIRWQHGYFDHRLRNRREEDECWNYILDNPVRAGLTARVEDWPWVLAPDGPATPA